VTAEQLPLDWSPASRARRTDPGSSAKAASEARAFVRGHAAEIVRLVLRHPGLTAIELANLPACDLTVVQVDRRADELERAGWIERDPPRHLRRRLQQKLRFFATERARAWARGEGS